MISRSFLCAALVAACCVPVSEAVAADWLQWGNDAAHSANNPDESAITSANVAMLSRRYQVTLADNVDSAPVFASGIVTASGTVDLLFLSARYSGKLTAVDAATGTVVWAKTTAAKESQSSPAIDPNRQFVYGYGGDGKVHKYAIGTGVETTSGGWPQVATLKPGVEKGAAALAIATSGSNTYLYVVNDGYVGDQGDYQGHITAINLATGAQKVFNSLCSDISVHMTLNGPPTTDCEEAQSGIWGRPGATYDAATDRVYITTGNGTFDANMGGLNWGDSVLALHPDGSGAGAGLPLDSFTPTTFPTLDSQDVDLGSASLSILPVAANSTVNHLGLQTGKDSKLHLIDLDNMSGTGAPGGVGGEVQLLDVPVSEFWMKTQPAIWVDTAGDGATWVFMANGSGLSGLKLIYSSIHEPSLLSTWTQTSDATSAIVANGILYHAGSCSGGICMIARNPRTGAVLWTSPTIGSLHWQSPILVNGALYIAAGTKLSRFDLGNPVTHIVTPAAGAHGSMTPNTPQTIADGSTTSFAITPDAHYAIDTVIGCGGTLAGGTYTTAPVTANCTVSASFVAITHTVTPTAGPHGQISPSTPQSVSDGSATAFTLTPDADYLIDSVTGCGGSLSGFIYTTATIAADCTVSATFALDTSDIIFRDGFETTGN